MSQWQQWAQMIFIDSYRQIYYWFVIRKQMSTEPKDNITTFKGGELVWGKLSGQSWWPGLITSIEDEEHGVYHVDFFGLSSNHALLSHPKIITYDQQGKWHEGSRPSPQLKRAMCEANMLYTTLQESKVSQLQVEPLTDNTFHPQDQHHLEHDVQEGESSGRNCGKGQNYPKQSNYNNGQKIISKPNCLRKTRNKASTPTLEDISMVLGQYGLDRIPLPLKDYLPNGQIGDLIKKLHSIVKKRYSGILGRQIAKKLAEKMIAMGQWKQILSQYKKSLSNQQLQQQYLLQQLNIDTNQFNQ